VVHPGGDAGAVIDDDELLGEVLGVGCPGVFGEVDEQSAEPVAVVLGEFFDAGPG
jgi:hypothetical protein